jgi:hypothetical protein
MTRGKISLAIAIVLISIGLIAVISNTDTSVKTLQLNLETKQQRLDILEAEKESINQQLDEAKGDVKKLKELEKKNQELEKAVEDAQARKAEKLRIAQEQAQNAVLAEAVQPQAVSGDCSSWMTAAGISHPLARDLIQRESGCNHQAVNPSSGACGIPQALPCSKLPQGINTSPVDQLIWMQNYIMGRYGSWEAAIAHHDANNWY